MTLAPISPSSATKSSSSSSYQPLPWPSSCTSNPPDASASETSDVFAALDALTTAKQNLSQAQAAYDAALDRVAQMVEEGILDPKTTHNDFQITRATRTTYAFPADHPIKQQEAALKEAKDIAIAFGEAEARTTVYFTVKAL